MEINVRNKEKLVEVWLTNAEKNDPAVQEQLKLLYARYKLLKYTVAAFQSGSRNLYQSTLDLLSYNKKRIAELEVLQEKKTHSAKMEH